MSKKGGKTVMVMAEPKKNEKGIDRVGEDNFEIYLRYRYLRGCIFCSFRYFRYRYH